MINPFADYGNLRIRPATPEDVVALAPRLRAADLQEIAARSGRRPEDVLLDGVTKSRECYAAELASGEVIALFGVGDTPEPRLGGVWLLGSDAIFSVRLTFLRHSLRWVRALSRGYDLLGNFVDERNTVHIAWLRWLGFRFLRRLPLGVNKEPFLEFVRLPESATPLSFV